MESVKQTVSNLVGEVGSIGYRGDHDRTTDGTTNSISPVHHLTTTTNTNDTASHNITGTAASSGGDRSLEQDTGYTGSSSTAAGGNTLGRDTGYTGSSATAAGGNSLGRDTTTATNGNNSGRDIHTTTGGNSLGRDTTSATTHNPSDNVGISRENKPGDIDISNKDGSGHHHDPTQVQSPSQGPDPALVGDPKSHPKLVGEGAPGSHSAVFGLTPDGKKYTDTTHGVTKLNPAHSAETTMGRKSVSAAPSGGDAGRDGSVSEQLTRPDTGKKGLERTDPLPDGVTSSGGKPGAGLTGV